MRFCLKGSNWELKFPEVKHFRKIRIITHGYPNGLLKWWQDENHSIRTSRKSTWSLSPFLVMATNREERRTVNRGWDSQTGGIFEAWVGDNSKWVGKWDGVEWKRSGGGLLTNLWSHRFTWSKISLVFTKLIPITKNWKPLKWLINRDE